jgi:DNA primase
MGSPQLDFDAIRASYTLPAIVSADVKLVRTGSEWKACCPFHADRSPSFTIFSGGQRFHCFGCGASGDVLDYLQPGPVEGGSDRVADAKAIWRAAEPAPGTLAETYLRSRGLHLPVPASIRFTRLRYGSKGREHPVLVAAVASAEMIS